VDQRCEGNIGRSKERKINGGSAKADQVKMEERAETISFVNV
jgi:hypothetical protein